MTLFLVSVAAFLAFQVIPGDVVRSILGTEATPEREAQLREELGLDKPPVERYISWADDVLHGDFGSLSPINSFTDIISFIFLEYR